MRIGILEPSGHDAVIHRKFSRHSLRSIGTLNRVELRRVRRRAESEIHGNILEQRHNGIRYQAIPMDCQKPFPIPALFCFACPYKIRAETYWIFAFDAAGKPLMRYTVSDAWMTQSAVSDA